MAGLGALSDNDKANLILKKTSFRDLLAKNPSGDTIRTVLTVKGDWFFNLLRSKAGIEEFRTWFSGYIDKNKFKKLGVEKASVGVSINDMFKLSTVRIERGTDYLFSRGFDINLNIIF